MGPVLLQVDWCGEGLFCAGVNSLGVGSGQDVGCRLRAQSQLEVAQANAGCGLHLVDAYCLLGDEAVMCKCSAVSVGLGALPHVCGMGQDCRFSVN